MDTTISHRREPPVCRRLSSFQLAAIGSLVAACLTVIACTGAVSDPSELNPTIRLVAPETAAAPIIQVDGVPSSTLKALDAAQFTTAEWTALLRVDVEGAGVSTSSAQSAAPPAVAGTYGVTKSAVTFTPMFGLDPGVLYRVTFDPSRLPSPHNSPVPRVVTTIGVPKPDQPSTTVVDHVYPSRDDAPENLLRLYVHFSAPMGRKGGLDYLKLIDGHGQEVKGAFLPLDTEFWNGDRTRFTAFLDPGRVKRGLLPHRQMGRSLELGMTYTLIVSREWPDARGVPLTADYRRTFRTVPADEKPLEPISRWRLTEPAVGSTDPFVVTFPEPLDHGLLMRAVGVETGAGAPLAGSSRVESGETRWIFQPEKPWQPGDYRLVVLSILEDASGNQIGRAFEVDSFETVDRSSEPERLTVPFRVK